MFGKFKTNKADFEIKEKDLLNWIDEPIIELFSTIVEQIKAEKVRMSLLLLFTLIDILSSYEYKYEFEEDKSFLIRFFKLNKGISNRRRYLNWLKEFVYTDNNLVYKKHKNNFPNKKYIWRIRCSFVHELTLPKGKKRVLPTHSELIPKLGPIKKDSIFLPYDLLYEAVKAGYLLWFNKLKDDIEGNPEKYIKNILKMHKELEQTALRTIKG